MPPGPTGHVNHVYEELTRRIELSRASGRQTESLETLRAATEWKSFRGAGRPSLSASGDDLSLEYHLAQSGAQGRPATVAQVLQSRGVIYIQDSPQLRNLDWSVDVARTMRQSVDGDLVVIVRLPRTDIAHFRPAKIYAPDDTAVLTRAQTSSDNAVTHAGQQAARSFQSSGCSDRMTLLSRDECPEDRRAVFLVVPKADVRKYQ